MIPAQGHPLPTLPRSSPKGPSEIPRKTKTGMGTKNGRAETQNIGPL